MCLSSRSVEIPTSNGQSVIVDAKYAAALQQHTWCWSGSREYVVSGIKSKTIYLHRYVYMLAHGTIPQGLMLHHINHDTGDNRLRNLKATSNSMNTHLSLRHAKGQTSSRYRGVNWVKSRKDWRATVSINGKLVHLGYFDDEVVASCMAIVARCLYGYKDE